MHESREKPSNIGVPMNLINNQLAKLNKLSPVAPLLLRVTLGVLLLLNGVDKFAGGISGVQDFFASTGVPLPAITAPLAAVLEVVIGSALILGVFTRISAVVMTGFFAVAIATVKAEGGILGSADIDLLYSAGLVSLLILGPGTLAVDNLLAKRNKREQVIDTPPAKPSTPTPNPTFA